MAKYIGDHKSRNQLPQFFYDGSLFCLAFVKSNNFARTFIKDTANAADLFRLFHGLLNFSQFNPVSHMLNLKIFAGGVAQFSLFIVISKIPGPVNCFRILMIQGILYKCFFCLLPVIVIAQGEGRAADTDFPAAPRFLHQPVRFI